MKLISIGFGSAVITWILGVCFYLTSFYIPLLHNAELQADLMLVIGIIPSAILGTSVFYRFSNINPIYLALQFALTAVVLDALITVPVFILPYGGSYASFFQNPMFYTILVEYFFVVFYYGKHLKAKK